MKVIAIFLMALMAVQQVVAFQPQERELRGIKDQIANIIKTIMDLIQSTMHQVIEEVTKGITEITGLMYDGIDLVNTGIDAILDLINNFEKKALDMGVDIAVCVVDQRKFCEELRVSTIENLSTTADRIIGGITEIKEETLATIDGYVAIVDDILADLKKCSIINILCMTNILARATAASIKATAELPLLAVKVIKIVGETVVGGTGDMLQITTDFTTTTARITYEITTCVAELMPIK